MATGRKRSRQAPLQACPACGQIIGRQWSPPTRACADCRRDGNKAMTMNPKAKLPRRKGQPPAQLSIDFEQRSPEQLARDGDYDPATSEIPF